MVELFTNYPPSTKKLLKGHCKRKGFKPFRSEKLTTQERKNCSQMVNKVYSYLSKDDRREILIPISPLTISQDHTQLLFCMTSYNGREIPVQIDTQPELNPNLLESDINRGALERGFVFVDLETRRFVSSYKDSETGEYKYFAFKDISDELE